MQEALPISFPEAVRPVFHALHVNAPPAHALHATETGLYEKVAMISKIINPKGISLYRVSRD